jgi:hypothetical protein
MRGSPAGTTEVAAGGRLITRAQRLFDKKHEAKLIRDELRSLCPRNAKVINIEPEQVDEKTLANLEAVKDFDWR